MMDKDHTPMPALDDSRRAEPDGEALPVITPSDPSLPSLLTKNGGLSDLVKPLKREIFLDSTFVAGTSHVKSSTVDSVKVGDMLTLRRETQNRFDERAILLLTSSGDKLGYIPEKDNKIYSRLMDAGKLLSARVTRINKKGDFSTIEIAIDMIEF